MNWRRVLPALALVAILALILVVPLQAAGAVVTLNPPAAAVNPGAAFDTNVSITGAEAVLGFQFDVLFDPNQVELSGFDLGPWLGSTGRSPAKLGPAMAADGKRATIGAYTLGQAAGAGGDGDMVVLHWKAKSAGNAVLSLDKLQLAGTGGTALEGSIGQGSVTVDIGGSSAGTGGSPGTGGGSAAGTTTDSTLLVVGAVGAVILAGGAFLLMRRGRAPGA